MEKNEKGAINEEIIVGKVFPKIKQWNLRPPFFIKSYWLADSTNNPPESSFDWYIDSDFKILDIRELSKMR